MNEWLVLILWVLPAFTIVDFYGHLVFCLLWLCVLSVCYGMCGLNVGFETLEGKVEYYYLCIGVLVTYVFVNALLSIIIEGQDCIL